MNGDREESSPLPVRGVIRHDLSRMPDVEFERLCYRLIRLEHPEVVKPAESSDGGVDALLPDPGGGYSRGWQSKHFPGRMRWDQCHASFREAQKTYQVDHYTFCFPRNLTKAEQKAFDRHFRGPDTKAKVDHWGEEEIQARLTETDRGRTVARHFFKDDGETIEALKRAVEAKGSLDTPADAHARMRPIADYLGSGDAYFTYAGSMFGDGTETGPPKGTVMSYSESVEGITSRIDVVPRDSEAMELYGPKGTMRLPADAYRRAQEVLAAGKEFTFEGVEYVWERLPPAFSEEIGRTGRADVTIGPARRLRATRWDARLTVENGGAKERLDVALEGADAPPGWDGSLEGEAAGLKVRLMMRRVGEGGQGELSYNYSLSDAPARRQLAALRLLDLAAAPGGTMRITDRLRGSTREAIFDTGAVQKSERLEALSAFLGWVAEIEDWTGRTLPMRPGAFTEENFEAVAEIAAAIRRGGFEVKVEEMEFLAEPDADPVSMEEAGPIIIRRDLSIRLLGEEVPLGPSQIVLAGYRIEEIGLDPQGRRRRRLRSENPEAAPTSFEQIASPKRANEPPRPPRKRNARRRGRSRRRGGR